MTTTYCLPLRSESRGFTGIPHFAPELFRRVRLKDPLKSKQLRQGLQQLAEEGATQVFFPERSNDITLARSACCSSTWSPAA